MVQRRACISAPDLLLHRWLFWCLERVYSSAVESADRRLEFGLACDSLLRRYPMAMESYQIKKNAILHRASIF